MSACSNCKFWVRLPAHYKDRGLVATFKGLHGFEEPDKTTPYGQCRRRSPEVVQRSVDDGKRSYRLTFTEFPDTPGHEWCGDWVARKDEPAA